ncbi:MAG TPA: amino acid adenylation domain-containing protein [Candidatus Angelobacter sp.]|nr:amino acid adenylation domain-containing protein [Candidatus Angelobacter sp.]
MAGYGHQEVPFEKLVEELSPQRDLGRTPLFQVMFALQNAPLPELRIGQATLAPFDFESGTSKFDWTLSLEEISAGLFGLLEYRTDLFDATTIRRMLTHYRSILAAIAADAKMPLDLIPFLGEAERRQLTLEWNNTAHLWPSERWVHEMFEDQAVLTPGALAVEFGAHRLSYAELNKRTNQLAHYLRKYGVGQEVRVAVCMERSLELVISLMAVLKAGGAYVPVDPEYPAERIKLMLEDAEAPVILSQANCVKALASATGKVVAVDSDWSNISRESSANPRIAVEAENLVYVIYTSGSTGHPKGAMNAHKGLRNRLLWMQHMYRLEESDRVLQKTPFSFDVSVWEFFWPLMVGAGLVVARPGGHQDPEYLGETIRACKVTTLHFVPSMLKVFLDSNAMENCSGVRRIICSGEALGQDVAKKCIERIPAQLHNLYGPTEASIDVTYWHCQKADIGVPIGRPISNIQTYVLDEQMGLAPIGVAGELYLGGVGLARGYWRRSDLTAEKFVPDPFAIESSGRLYRTGDWARWKSDGSIEYIGRRDEQVKLRGNRIELGEIETALRHHSNIKDAAVVVSQDAAGEKRLVAYLVPQKAQIPSQTQLRKYLADKMPDYMVPAVYVQLAEFPLSPNGKLDRRRLPATSMEQVLSENVYVAPTSPIEELLLGVWEDVLGFKKIGIQANFFALGGHSLLATRVTARIKDIFKVDVPLRRLFESPTVAALSQIIESAIQAKASGKDIVSAPELEPVTRDGNLPLSFAQQRLWFLNQLTPEDTSYNVPGAIRIDGPLDVLALEQSLQTIVQRHEVLRTSFVEFEGEPRQVIEEILELHLAQADLSALATDGQEAEILRLAEEEAHLQFDLRRAPMFRAKLLCCGEESHVLLMTLHHIVSDGWSLGILVKELTACYEAFTNDQPSTLPVLRVQYADFSVWQRKWLCGRVLEQQVAYWKQHLKNTPPALELPTDRSRPPVQTTHGAQKDASLDAELAAAVKRFAREQGVTVFMTLLSSFQSLLYRYTGQDNILVGTPIAGRTRVEIEGLIGCFVNTLVMKAEFAGNLTFAGLMQQVKESTLEAYTHQDLPFEKLVDELAPQRDLSRSPLFQVMFVLQNVPASELRLGEAKLRRIELGTKRANFDLELVYSEDDVDGIQGYLEYNTDLFDLSTIDRLLGHYRQLLQSLLAEPGKPITALPLLTGTERRQLLYSWNDSFQKLPENVCFHQVFEQLTKQTPEAVAASCGETCITYHELNARANGLASWLRKKGVNPEAIIALLMDRSIDFLVCMLAVFKAGGVYLPLDPKHPVQRQLQLLRQSCATHVISAADMTRELETSQEWNEALRPAFFHIEDLGLLPDSDIAPDAVSDPAHAAYVIYTSGSTGTPKGAVIEHLGMLNHLYAKVKDLCLQASDVIAQTASQCFDISVWQFLAPLVVGARVAVFPDSIVADPKELFDYAILLRVTILEIVPSLLRAALEEIESGRMPAPRFSTLRWLLLTGEALPSELVRRWLQHFPDIPIMNAYGPTECSDDVAHYGIHAGASFECAQAPIGVPIINTQLFVLDEQMEPVPVGVPGELYVGGIGVGRGYLHDPMRTAQAFVPDDFSARDGARLYRTGDLVRRLPSGEILYLHRTDHQIKMRGFRIELGEIEAALERHPDVLQAAVVMHQDQRQSQRLVAYLVTRKEVTAGALRDALLQGLPEYMVPSNFVALPALPLTANGKLDRKALLPPPETKHAVIGPRNLIEARLAEIWKQVLAISSVGVDENFFQIGGHSLIAVRMMAMIRNHFQRSLPLASLFQNPTIASLARMLAQKEAQEDRILVVIQSQGGGTPFFCVHPVGGGVLCYAELAHELGQDRPFYGLQYPRPGSVSGPLERIEDLAVLYIREIRQVQPRGPYLLGGWSMGGLIAVEMAAQLMREGESVKPLVLFDTYPAQSGTAMGGEELPILALFAADICRLLGRDHEILRERFLQLAPGDQEQWLLQELKNEGILAHDASAQEMQQMLDIFAHNISASENYSLPQHLDRILFFRAADTAAGKALVEHWETATGSTIDFHVVPGDHYTMLKHPNVAVVAEHMKRYFQEIDKERPLTMQA